MRTLASSGSVGWEAEGNPVYGHIVSWFTVTSQKISLTKPRCAVKQSQQVVHPRVTTSKVPPALSHGPKDLTNGPQNTLTQVMVSDSPTSTLWIRVSLMPSPTVFLNTHRSPHVLVTHVRHCKQHTWGVLLPAVLNIHYMSCGAEATPNREQQFFLAGPCSTHQ